jgi:hypothetical protein
MNKLAIITAFLEETRNRYMVYQGNRTLAEKFALAKTIPGLDGFELCYPADFENPAELKALLRQYGFGLSGMNFRSRRTGKWWRGAFIAESPAERREVVDDLKRAMDAAGDFGIGRISTCPLNDGADTLFELDYDRAYDSAAETFGAACAHNPAIKICIEYKKSDPVARCLFGTAGETAAFCLWTGLHNLGATLDLGHALYASSSTCSKSSAIRTTGTPSTSTPRSSTPPKPTRRPSRSPGNLRQSRAGSTSRRWSNSSASGTRPGRYRTCIRCCRATLSPTRGPSVADLLRCLGAPPLSGFVPHTARLFLLAQIGIRGIESLSRAS